LGLAPVLTKEIPEIEATARCAPRSREIGLRKVIGSKKRDLRLQFMSESVFTALFAAVLAVTLVEVAKPWLSSVAGRPIHLNLVQPVSPSADRANYFGQFRLGCVPECEAVRCGDHWESSDCPPSPLRVGPRRSAFRKLLKKLSIKNLIMGHGLQKYRGLRVFGQMPIMLRNAVMNSKKCWRNG